MVHSGNPTEEEIIRGCVAGRRKFQTLLYQKYARSLFAVCLRYSKDTAEAEDLLQESFIKIFSSIKDYRGDGPLKAWLTRIIINTALTRFRKNQPLVSHNMDEVPESSNDDSDDSIFTQVTPEHCSQIIGFIQELPDGYRQVFNLYIFEGMSHKDISNLLGITEITSRTQLRKARLWLREKILKLLRS
ncbi:MAG: RNA polymerase sigma factor [Bacteroidales bacterium]